MSEDEWHDAGFREYFRDDSVCLVEWPERVARLLPAPDLALSLSYATPAGRELVVAAHSEAGERCLSALAAEATPSR